MAIHNNPPRAPRTGGNGNANPQHDKSDHSDASDGNPPQADGGAAQTPDNGVAQNSRFFKGGFNRYDSTYENGRNNRYDSAHEIGRNDRRFPTRAPKYPGGGGGFRNSHTWVSSETQHMQEFLVIRNSMRRLFKHSEVAKWKYQDYIAHEEARVASKKELLAAQVKMKEEEKNLIIPRLDENALVTLKKFLPGGNFTMEGGRSRVLGEKTIWCEHWKAEKEEISPWPSFAELKWEGDDRAKTGVGRFPPLPREMGAPGIPWNQLQAVEQYLLDQVARIPTMEDVYLPVDEIDDDVKYTLINKDLEEDMDKCLES